MCLHDHISVHEKVAKDKVVTDKLNNPRLYMEALTAPFCSHFKLEVSFELDKFLSAPFLSSLQGFIPLLCYSTFAEF